MGQSSMIFEPFAVGGCRSYLIGCSDTLSAALDADLITADDFR